MGDDGNRQVALTVERVGVELGLNAEQFDTLTDLMSQQEQQLGAIGGAVLNLTERIAEPDTSVAAEIRLLRQEITVGFSGIQQSIADLNNTIFERFTDAAKWLAAIALAASTPDDNSAAVQAQIDQHAAEIKTAKETLQSSINRNQPKENE